jgi:hypothetical protein
MSFHALQNQPGDPADAVEGVRCVSPVASACLLLPSFSLLRHSAFFQNQKTTLASSHAPSSSASLRVRSSQLCKHHLPTQSSFACATMSY